MKETWKPIEGYEGKEVSDYGNIRNILTGNLYELPANNNGYVTVCLRKNGKGHNLRVHRLVMETFVGKSSEDVLHRDDDKTNNHLSNLRYGTDKENAKDRYLNNGHPNQKLTEDNVDEIFYMKEFGFSQNTIASHFDIPQSSISKILNNKQWSYARA